MKTKVIIYTEITTINHKSWIVIFFHVSEMNEKIVNFFSHNFNALHKCKKKGKQDIFMSSFSTPYRDVSLVTYIVLLVNQHEYFNVVQFFFTLWWSNNFVWDNLEIFPAFTKLHQDKTSRIRNYSWQNCPRLHIHFEFWAPHISNDFLATIFSMVR